MEEEAGQKQGEDEAEGEGELCVWTNVFLSALRVSPPALGPLEKEYKRPSKEYKGRSN